MNGADIPCRRTNSYLSCLILWHPRYTPQSPESYDVFAAHAAPRLRFRRNRTTWASFSETRKPFDSAVLITSAACKPPPTHRPSRPATFSQTSDLDPVRITFTCDAPGDPQWCDIQNATIEIEIGSSGMDYVGDTAFNSVLRLLAGDHRFEVERVLYGYELRGFAEDLQTLYETLHGSARLQDWDGEPLLCITVLNRGRGEIALGGRFTPIVLDTQHTSADRYISETVAGRFGVVVAFEGFTLNQSMLKLPLTDLRRFVYEHRTECESTCRWTCPGS